MLKKMIINEKEYELTTNYKEAFDKEEFQKKYTEYFDDYDYIVGDWAYGKLRLKGFCDRVNKIYNHMNDIQFLDEYITSSCAYDCKYFVLKRL